MMSDYYDQCRFYGGPIHYPGSSGAYEYSGHEGFGEDFELIRSANNALAESESLDASLEIIEGDSHEDDDIQHTTQSSTQPAKVQVFFRAVDIKKK